MAGGGGGGEGGGGLQQCDQVHAVDLNWLQCNIHTHDLEVTDFLLFVAMIRAITLEPAHVILIR